MTAPRLPANRTEALVCRAGSTQVKTLSDIGAGKQAVSLVTTVEMPELAETAPPKTRQHDREREDRMESSTIVGIALRRRKGYGQEVLVGAADLRAPILASVDGVQDGAVIAHRPA